MHEGKRQIKTSQLGFYMGATLAINGLNNNILLLSKLSTTCKNIFHFKIFTEPCQILFSQILSSFHIIAISLP